MGRTHIQILQTVPAEGVFAALTQHLGTALVPLNVDTAHWTLFDGHVRVVVSADPVTGKISHIVLNHSGIMSVEAERGEIMDYIFCLQSLACLHILQTAILTFSWNNASGHLTNVNCQFLSIADMFST